MNNLIAAVDLGTTKIVVAVGEKTRTGVRIAAYSKFPSKGVERGRVVNVQQVKICLDDALENIQEKLGKRVQKVFVGIAGQDIKCTSPQAMLTSRDNPNDFITEEEIASITKKISDSQLEDGYRVISAIPQCFNVDNFMSVEYPAGMIGKSILSYYKLISGKENSIRLIQSALNFSNLKMIDMVLEPVASAKAVLTSDDMEMGTVLVDIGGGTTDIAVIQKNIVRYVACIPFGGNSITEDIAKGCKIPHRQAESLKVKYGSCFADYVDANKTITIIGANGAPNKEIHMKILAKIIQARMEEILEAVSWHIEQSGFKKLIGNGIVITGGGAQIENLTNLASFVTGFETRCACPNEFLIDPDSQQEAMDYSASTAVGMVISAFEKMRQERASYSDSVVDVQIEQEAENQEFATVAAREEKPERKPKAKGGSWFKKAKDKFSNFSGDLFGEDNLGNNV